MEIEKMHFDGQHLKKVFAGGDAVHGADLVVTAMAAGRQAARDMLTLFDTKAS